MKNKKLYGVYVFLLLLCSTNFLGFGDRIPGLNLVKITARTSFCFLIVAILILILKLCIDGKLYIDGLFFGVLFTFILFIIFESVISYVKYSDLGGSAITVVNSALHYISPFLAYWAFIQFKIDKNARYAILEKYILAFGFISNLVAIFSFLLFERFQINILGIDTTVMQNFRNGSIRFGIGDFCVLLALFICLIKVLDNKASLYHLSILCMSIYQYVFITKTRMMIFTIIVLIVFSIVILNRRGVLSKATTVFILVCAALFVLANYKSLYVYVNSYISEDHSILTRFSEINYYYEHFLTEPLLGSGFINPKSEAFYLFEGGITGRWSKTDLGVLGFLFQFGIVGIVIVFQYIRRQIHTLKISNSKYNKILVLIVVYEIITMMSLFFFREEACATILGFSVYFDAAYSADINS